MVRQKPEDIKSGLGILVTRGFARIFKYLQLSAHESVFFWYNVTVTMQGTVEVA
jgi:hypothetical protein